MRNVTLCLIVLLLMSLFGPGVEISAQSEGEFDGAWLASEYGLVFVIEGDSVLLYVLATCEVALEMELDGNTVLNEGQVDSTLQLEGDTLTFFDTNGAAALTAARFDEFESVCPPLAAEIEVSVTSVETWDDYDALAADIFAQTRLPGMAVAVVTSDGVQWSQGYGYANVEAEMPVTTDTPFAIASITKTFTGTGLMIAYEAGAIGLNDPVNDWLPFVVDNPHVEGEVITLRHLATHTAGLLDYGPNYNSLEAPGDPTIELGDYLEGYLTEGGEWYLADENFAPRFPGEVREYSNIGAALAGYIVEMATGTPLDIYAQEHLFDPLNMTQTGWKLAAFEDTSIIAVPYDRAGNALEHYGYPTWPDGMLRTSVNDLGTFLAMIMNGGELDGVRILSAESVDLMLQPQLETAPLQGWFWDLGIKLPGMIGHGGNSPGVYTAMFFNPELDIGVIVLINSDSEEAVSVFQTLIPLTFEHASALVMP